MPDQALRAALEALDAPIQAPSDLLQLDLKPIAVLDAGHKATLVAEIAARLGAGRDDPRLVDALVEIGSKAAWQQIEALAAAAEPSVSSARAARRLGVLRRDRRAVRWLAAALRSWTYVVEEAATGLYELDNNRADEALLEALAGRDEVEIRRVLLDRLFVRHGLDAWQLAASPVWSARMAALSPWPSLRAEAIAVIGRWVRGARGGATPQALGVAVPDVPPSAAMTALLKALRDPNATLDAGQLAILQGGERDWAVDLLGKALERGEFRAVAALHAVGGARAQMVLDDARALDLPVMATANA